MSTASLRFPWLAGFLAGSARLISGVSTRWVDSKPEAGQRVYFANHTSHLDFVVLWAALPRELRAVTRPVAARDYWANGRLRRYLTATVFNAVLIDRTHPGPSVIDRLLEALGDENSLIIFPEGTRGNGEKVGEFKSGIYYLCRQKPELALVPAWLENLNRILPKGEYLPVPLLSRVTFGAPMRLDKNESRAAFLERARAAVCALKEA